MASDLYRPAACTGIPPYLHCGPTSGSRVHSGPHCDYRLSAFFFSMGMSKFLKIIPQHVDIAWHFTVRLAAAGVEKFLCNRPQNIQPQSILCGSRLYLA